MNAHATMSRVASINPALVRKATCFIGRPGAGKSTVAAIVGGTLNIPVIGLGAIFRTRVRAGAVSTATLRADLDAGRLVDDGLVLDALRTELMRLDPTSGVILDGFPRTLSQAYELESLLSEVGLPMGPVIELALAPERAEQRARARRRCANCAAVAHDGSQPADSPYCIRCGGSLESHDATELLALAARAEIAATAGRAVFDHYAERFELTRIGADRPVGAVANAALRLVLTRTPAAAYATARPAS